MSKNFELTVRSLRIYSDNLLIFLEKIHGDFFWKYIFPVIYWPFVCIEPFMGTFQAYKVYQAETGSLQAISMETFSLYIALGFVLMWFGIQNRKFELFVSGFVGLLVNIFIVVASLQRGAEFLWQ